MKFWQTFLSLHSVLKKSVGIENNDKMKKDIQLVERDQVTIYEMSLTFFVIIQ